MSPNHDKRPSIETVRQALEAIPRLCPRNNPEHALELARLIDTIVIPAIFARYGKGHSEQHARMLWEHFQGEPYGTEGGYVRLPSALRSHAQYWEECMLARIHRACERGTPLTPEVPNLELDACFAALCRLLAEKLYGLPPIPYTLSYQPRRTHGHDAPAPHPDDETRTARNERAHRTGK